MGWDRTRLVLVEPWGRDGMGWEWDGRAGVQEGNRGSWGGMGNNGDAGAAMGQGFGGGKVPWGRRGQQSCGAGWPPLTRSCRPPASPR